MPKRTCLGCKGIREKKELVRFAAPGGALEQDMKGALDGRGAYLCPDKRCFLEAFGKKDAFSRALRQKVDLPGDPMEFWRNLKINI